MSRKTDGNGNTELLGRLRSLDIPRAAGVTDAEHGTGDEIRDTALTDFITSGVRFASGTGPLEGAWLLALRKLLDCIAVSPSGGPMLIEGGVYRGCWLESTGTINAEILSRFMPSTAGATFELFSRFLRDDGLMPYKITADGPAYRQIQMVTPLARSVWNHYLLSGRDGKFLRTMYAAMERFDGWLARYRDTRKTGCVEAFCTYDTGHDLSPRFWHVPDTTHLFDAASYDPDSPLLPFLAPDLTANVACQRRYLAKAAAELGHEAEYWTRKADASVESLWKQCWNEEDDFFYDRDREGRHVRVLSDVLLRVLACEIGSGDLFAESLEDYLLNTRHFFSRYPFTSISMADPRFDPHTGYNTWAGAVNFLSLIRAPHAFEYHGRFVELTCVLQPIVSALSRMTRFAQCLSPWTGEEGFTECYSPAILCMFDFVERLCGILPRPDGELWFTGLLPYPMDAGKDVARDTAYRRTVDGVTFELTNTRERCTVYRDSAVLAGFPYGVRLVTDRGGALAGLVGMTARTIDGVVSYGGREIRFRAGGNERFAFRNGDFERTANPGVIAPRSD